MRDIKRNPSTRRAAGASEGVVAGRRDRQKIIRPQTETQAGEIAVYDGRDYLGRLVPRGTGWLAYGITGQFLGGFASDRLGARAVYEANRPGGVA